MMVSKSYNEVPRNLEILIEKRFQTAASQLRGTLISPYQPKGVKFLIKKELTGPGCILADEMGLGKTVMTVTFMLAMKHHYAQQGVHLPTLVVAPKSVCQQWVHEIHKFSGLNVRLYDKRGHSHAIDNDVDALVVSFSFFTRDTCLQSSIYSTRFQRVILDEAHLIKNPNTVSSKNIRAIRCDKKLCLSGTPIQNDPKDLFSLVRWIFKDDPQKLQLASRGVSLTSKSKEKKQMCTEFIRDCILLRRTLDDVSAYNRSLSLPSLGVRVLSIPFHSNEECQLYKHVQELARERIQSVLKSSSYNTQSNMDILEALLRCRQVCIHPSLFLDAVRDNSKVAFKWGRAQESGAGRVDLLSDVRNRNKIDMPSTKLDTLVSLILAQPPDDKTLIFSSFVKEMLIIQKLLQRSGVTQCLLYYGDMSSNDRETVLDTFKQSTSPHAVLIIQMNAGGTGLNLQEANRCYITSPAYNPSLEMQCIARSHRTGQSKPVTCVRLVMQDSVEEKILDIQNKKLQMISSAFDDERILSKLSTQSFALTKRELASLFDIQLSEKVRECQLSDSELSDLGDSLPDVVDMSSSDESDSGSESETERVHRAATQVALPYTTHNKLYDHDLCAFDDL